MNTEKMSHVVSMTANVGVLIGLSLLVYELNQNNAYLQEQAEFVAFESRKSTHFGFTENEEIARLAYSHLGSQPLNEIDELRRVHFFSGVFVHWQWRFERTRTGLIKEFDSLDHMASTFRTAMQLWKAEDAWSKRKNYYSTDFREFMDTQVIGPG